MKSGRTICQKWRVIFVDKMMGGNRRSQKTRGGGNRCKEAKRKKTNNKELQVDNYSNNMCRTTGRGKYKGEMNWQI